MNSQNILLRGYPTFIFILRTFSKPYLATIIALGFYCFVAFLNNPLFESTCESYYNYLADAFLHGQLSLRTIPACTHDLIIYNQHYFLYWPPMPAFLMMPFIALFGVGFSDIFFTVFIGAFNVGVITLVLKEAKAQKVVNIGEIKIGLLVFFFTFGTVHSTMASFGRVWFTGQLTGFLFVSLTYLIALRSTRKIAFLLLGIMLAAALLTRIPLLFVGLWPLFYILNKSEPKDWKDIAGSLILASIPVALAVLFYGWYNWARFGNPIDLGTEYHLMSVFFVDDYTRYGMFNLHYVPVNFYYQYVYYPLPLRITSPLGGSLFLLSPVFFYVFLGIKLWRNKLSLIVLLASIFLVNIPILLLMGTGWIQWGPRYTLDFTVPLLLLTAAGINRVPIRVLSLLVMISVIHYLFGIFLYIQWF